MSGKFKKNYGEVVELNIESIGFEGVAVARRDELVHFVKWVVPGDKIKAVISRKKRHFAEARLLEIIEPSPNRIKPECKYFGICGGCSWQNLDYREQLKWKKKHVTDAFEHLAKIPGIDYLDTMPSAYTFSYRNKMEFSFASTRWLTQEEISAGEEIDRSFALGLHIPQKYDKVLDIESCSIQSPIGNKILQEVRKAAIRLGASIYEQKERAGFLRNLIIRNSRASGEIMVILVTTLSKTENDDDFLDWFVNDLPVFVPSITTLVHAVNDKITPVAVGEPTVIRGSGFITETISGVNFRISPYSFFQTNSEQFEVLLSVILDYADLQKNEVIWDLYCGAGSISLPTARHCSEVYGLELSPGAIEDAKKNAELNDIKNAAFFCADLHEKSVDELIDALPRPDKIIIDPPRAGMHKNLVIRLLEIESPVIIYVSCNPATLARDCALLAEKYTVEKVQPVDMFPQTYHVESVALLKKKDASAAEAEHD